MLRPGKRFSINPDDQSVALLKQALTRSSRGHA